ncbi:type II toxin-antitoxin system RelE/ParE family toxin [Salinarimonas sp.]|uniref:type II toxin-antitoxin system RelE/ParE family toxin n=1 Tax=Salinarimonas sp. TaxID=2766526 RepID=UPI003919BCFE
MPARLRIAPAAARDLDKVRLWLRQPGSGRQASLALRNIAAAIADLASAPFRWPESVDHPRRRVRIVRGHTIVYRVEPDDPLLPAEETRVIVLRVFQPRQNRVLG